MQEELREMDTAVRRKEMREREVPGSVQADCYKWDIGK
jgi:hypothetical protein